MWTALDARCLFLESQCIARQRDEAMPLESDERTALAAESSCGMPRIIAELWFETDIGMR